MLLRGSSVARVQSGIARGGVSRSTVVVQAVQDLQGRVVSKGMQRSVVVAVERLSPHDKYQKRVRITKRYVAHDDGSLELSTGDYVRLEGCRPLSKNKRFKVAEVLRKAE